MAVLEWMNVPLLAMGDDGCVTYANWAFADMIGWTPDMVLSSKFRQLFAVLPQADSAVAVLQAHAETVVELTHLDGSLVQAAMSEPLVLADGELAVVTFDDMTELLWLREA